MENRKDTDHANDTRIALVENNLLHITESLLRLEKLMAEGFARVDQRFEQIEKRFDQIDKRFDRIESKVDKLENRIWTITFTVLVSLAGFVLNNHYHWF